MMYKITFIAPDDYKFNVTNWTIILNRIPHIGKIVKFGGEKLEVVEITFTGPVDVEVKLKYPPKLVLVTPGEARFIRAATILSLGLALWLIVRWIG